VIVYVQYVLIIHTYEFKAPILTATVEGTAQWATLGDAARISVAGDVGQERRKRYDKR
jgi:hypothetical protein